MRPDPLLADPDAGLAEVGLRLLPGTRLEPNRGPLRRLQRPSPALHPLLDRTRADPDPGLTLQLLANDVGVSARAEETLPRPTLQAIERRLALGLAERHRAAGAKIAPDRVARAAELLRQPLGPPAKLVEPRHRGHLLRLKHLFSPHS